MPDFVDIFHQYMLFSNKMFMLDDVTRQNDSKFAILNIDDNSKLLLLFFISCYIPYFFSFILDILVMGC